MKFNLPTFLTPSLLTDVTTIFKSGYFFENCKKIPSLAASFVIPEMREVHTPLGLD